MPYTETWFFPAGGRSVSTPIPACALCPMEAIRTCSKPWVIRSRADVMKRFLAFLFDSSHKPLPTIGISLYGIPCVRSLYKADRITKAAAIRRPCSAYGLSNNWLITAMVTGKTTLQGRLGRRQRTKDEVRALASCRFYISNFGCLQAEIVQALCRLLLKLMRASRRDCQ